MGAVNSGPAAFDSLTSFAFTDMDRNEPCSNGGTTNPKNRNRNTGPVRLAVVPTSPPKCGGPGTPNGTGQRGGRPPHWGQRQGPAAPGTQTSTQNSGPVNNCWSTNTGT